MDEEWWRPAIDARRAEIAAKMNARKKPVWSLDLYSFTPDALGKVARQAASGHRLSEVIIQQVIAMGRGLTEPSPKDRLSCLTCDYIFGRKPPPSYLSVLTAGCDDPAKARISGICHHCAARFGSQEGIQRGAFEACHRITAGYREQVRHR